ncbi:MAG TPA: insulinase family protein, partial [Candidatus Eisenbacteria bacterium]
MKNPPRRSWAGPALALVLLAFPPSRAGAHPLEATQVKLKNGMRVVLAPDSLATAVDVAVWFPAGTRSERPGQAGLAVLAARLGFRNGAADPLAPLAAEGGTGTLVATPDYTSFSAT